MKTFKIIIVTIFAAVLVISGIHAQTQKKKTIAVLNFVNSGGVDQNEISILTERFNNYLVNTEVYDVLEREKMDAILKEQDFTMTDNCNSSECAVQVGQLLGMEYMIAGKVGKFGDVYTLDIRIIDVSTGKILRTKSENYEGKKEGLLDMIEAMAYTISGKSAPVKKTTTTAGTGGVTIQTGTANGTDNANNVGDEIEIGTVTKKYGSLEINCEMDGTLYMDDKQIGEVTEGSIIPIEKLKVGEHTIKIVYSEGEFSETVKIDFNQKTTLTTKKTFKDPRDGKVYKTVKIGNQVWMAENFNYDAGSGSWCYNNNASYCGKYGRLYDWETAKRVAPPGWHLPSKSEFETLLRNLGGEGANAYKQIINGGSSGFNALFGGWRKYDGHFNNIEAYAYFWSSTEHGNKDAWHLDVYSDDREANMDYGYRTYGLSVRYVKD